MERKELLESFTKDLAEKIEFTLKERYGIRADPEPHMVLKTNCEKAALTIHIKDSNVAPTIYTEDLYQKYLDGMSMPAIVSQVTDVIYESQLDAPEIPEFTLEEAREHITLTLVNTEQNQELLKKTPHFEILDGELSAIPRWYISDEASFVVNNSIASKMMLTPGEVLQIGQQHINQEHFTIQRMQEVLSAMLGEDMDLNSMGMNKMLVVSSESRIQGSNALLSEDTMKQVHETIGDFAVLPSSLHEVICIPADESMDPEVLRMMVHSINMSEVSPEDRLSDQIFMHDGEHLKLVGDTFQMDNQQMESQTMSHSMRMAF